MSLAVAAEELREAEAHREGAVARVEEEEVEVGLVEEVVAVVSAEVAVVRPGDVAEASKTEGESDVCTMLARRSGVVKRALEFSRCTRQLCKVAVPIVLVLTMGQMSTRTVLTDFTMLAPAFPLKPESFLSGCRMQLRPFNISSWQLKRHATAFGSRPNAATATAYASLATAKVLPPATGDPYRPMLNRYFLQIDINNVR